MILASLALLGLAAACGRLDVSDAGPLSIRLTVTPAAAATGQSIDFRFNASGDQLAGITLAFGDGSIDTVATFLARTAVGTRTHAYADAGSYRALVTVTDVGGATARDSVTVQVTATSPPSARPR